MKIAIVLIALFMTGCAGLNNPQMSAEQLAAAAKDVNSNATVISYTGAGGQGIFSSVNTDRGSLGTNGGSVTVHPNGEISITVNPKPIPIPK